VGQNVAPQVAYAEKSSGILRAMGDEIADIVQKARPAVVRIESTTIVKPGGPGDPRRYFEEMFPPGFREWIMPRIPEGELPPLRGLGSGFIIDSKGLILTNSHVVQDTDEIEVILDDGRKFPGKVVGSDPESEVAVVKIDAKDLPTVETGDSDSLKVGNLVVAIGSPQGLFQSVSFGIVSALNRSEVGITAFPNFIQTDAAINRGNSGGPLLDIEGRVVGICTAIISTSGGSEGLGLSIPINQALKWARQLEEFGEVRRGYLGVQFRDLAGFAEHLGTGDAKGAVVVEVQPNTPAEGNLKVNDAIISVNDEKLSSGMDLLNRIATLKPGEKVELGVIRDGKGMAVKIELAKRPGAEELASGGAPKPSEKPGGPADEDVQEMGFSVRPLAEGETARLGLPPGQGGLLVTQVRVSSKAYGAGLREGMVIEEANKGGVRTADELREALKAGKDKDTVMLRVRHRQGAGLVLIPKN
jgi:serine protease Do